MLIIVMVSREILFAGLVPRMIRVEVDRAASGFREGTATVDGTETVGIGTVALPMAP